MDYYPLHRCRIENVENPFDICFHHIFGFLTNHNTVGVGVLSLVGIRHLRENEFDYWMLIVTIYHLHSHHHMPNIIIKHGPSCMIRISNCLSLSTSSN